MISKNFERDCKFRIAAGASVLMLILILTAGSAAAVPPDLTGTVSENYGSAPGSDIPFSEKGIVRPYPHHAASQADSSSAKNAYAQVAAANDINITKVGHFGGVTYAIEVSGNYAYTGQGSDFVVLDISNKMAPVEAGRVETNSIIMDIAVAGNYAYVADGDYLVIVDVSNPAAHQEQDMMPMAMA